MENDFYVGWEERAPAQLARTLRRVVLGLASLIIVLAGGLAWSQRLIGVAQFAWGQPRAFRGVLYAEPYPHLVLPGREAYWTAPSTRSGGESANRPVVVAAPLVAPLKHGVDRASVAEFDGRFVRLRATRIFRDDQLMLELEPGSVELTEPPTRSGSADTNLASRAAVSLGRWSLRGEIVDSKCWLGVMNPGVLVPHRACAVRCIQGGIPPMLLVRRADAPPFSLLLVDPRGDPVNEQVLDYVADPVEVTGEIIRRHNLLFLRAEVSTIRRRANDTAARRANLGPLCGI